MQAHLTQSVCETRPGADGRGLHRGHMPVSEVHLDGEGVEVGRIAETIGLSREVVLDLLALFVTTSRTDLTRIEEAIGEGDMGKVAEAAHSLKGAALNFEFGDISSAAKDLELRARRREIEGEAAVLELIKRRIEAIARSIGAGAGHPDR